MTQLLIGTAAWNIPKEYAGLFPVEGSHLQRYSKALRAVEINSSFYRDHKPATYARWAEETPTEFKFTVKLAKQITHDQKLICTQEDLDQKFAGYLELTDKLGAVLIQLPPSLKFNRGSINSFFRKLRRAYEGPVVLEPRHTSWISDEAAELFKDYEVNKVIADPEPCRTGDENYFLGDVIYYRLHGSPEIYVSNYNTDYLKKIKTELKAHQARGKTCWCIFDNTTFGYATKNAAQLEEMFQNHISEFSLEAY